MRPAVILLLGGCILRNCWHLKLSSMVVMNELRACQPTETNVHQQQQQQQKQQQQQQKGCNYVL